MIRFVLSIVQVVILLPGIVLLSIGTRHFISLKEATHPSNLMPVVVTGLAGWVVLIFTFLLWTFVP